MMVVSEKRWSGGESKQLEREGVEAIGGKVFKLMLSITQTLLSAPPVLRYAEDEPTFQTFCPTPLVAALICAWLHTLNHTTPVVLLFVFIHSQVCREGPHLHDLLAHTSVGGPYQRLVPHSQSHKPCFVVVCIPAHMPRYAEKGPTSMTFWPTPLGTSPICASPHTFDNTTLLPEFLHTCPGMQRRTPHL